MLPYAGICPPRYFNFTLLNTGTSIADGVDGPSIDIFDIIGSMPLHNSNTLDPESHYKIRGMQSSHFAYVSVHVTNTTSPDLQAVIQVHGLGNWFVL